MKGSILITALTVGCASPSFSAVNLKTAGLTKTIREPVTQLILTYQSRSLFRGVFGYGWCSDVDTRLVRKNGDSVLRLCEYEMPMGKQKNIRLLDGREFNFDEDGRLIAYSRLHDRFLLTYDKDQRISRLLRRSGQAFELTWHGQTIGGIKDTRGYSSRILYENQNLIEIRDNKVSTFRFKYDDFHNLTKMIFKDGSEEAYTFDQGKDWVLTVTHRDRCQDQFEYEWKDDSPVFRSKARRFCNNKLIKIVDRSYSRGGQ